MNREIKTCVIVVRVSTQGQVERGTHKKQEELLPAYAQQQGWTVLEMTEDLGRSGRRLEGRAVEVVLKRIEVGNLKPDVLLVENTARLMRPDPDDVESQVEAARIIATLRKCDVLLADIDGKVYDLKHGGDLLQYRVLSAVNERDWRDRQVNMSRGRWRKAAEGKKPWGLDPWGLQYKKARDQATDRVTDEWWEFHEGTLRTIRWMFKSAVSMSLGQIAEWLNENGVPTRSGRGIWTDPKVHRVLRQTAYFGELRPDKKNHPEVVLRVPSPGRGEPPVDKALFDQVQVALRSRRKTGGRRHGLKYQALCRRLIRCGCGRAMHVRPSVWKRGNKTWKAWMYVCPLGGCRRNYNAAKVDAEVWRVIREMIKKPEVLADAAQLRSSGESSVESHEKVLGKCKSEAARLAEVESTFTARFRRGKLSEAALDRELERIATERELLARTQATAERYVAQIKGRRQALQGLRDVAGQIAKEVDSASFEKQRQILELLVPNRREFGVRVAASGEIAIHGVLPVPGPSSVSLGGSLHSRDKLFPVLAAQA